MDSAPAFEDVAHSLAAGGSVVHAAEAHGCLCGAIAARSDYSLDEWLKELRPEPQEMPDERVLSRLYADTVRTLRGPDLDFEPLLPADESPLPERVEALGAWCQGYLYGLGSAGTGDPLPMSEDTAEILEDLAEIARAGSSGSAEEETEENAYAELVEFIRVGVQLVDEELDDWRRAQALPKTRH